MPEIHASHDVWEDYDPDPFWMCSTCHKCACCTSLEDPCNTDHMFEEF